MTPKAHRILIIGRYMASFGGAHKYLRSLIKNLTGLGSDVVVIMNACGENQAFRDDIENLGARLKRVQFDELSRSEVCAALDEILEVEDPHVIDCEVAAKSVRRGILSSERFRSLSCLKIFTMHLAIKSEAPPVGVWEDLYPFSSRNRTLREMRQFLSLFNRGISVSKFHAARIEDLLKLPSNFFAYIPNGVQLDEFLPEPRASIKEVVVGGCGSLTRQKRFDLLLDAVAILRDRGIFLNCKIAGEGEQRTILEEKIATLDLKQNVELLGHVASTRSFFQELDIFVMCSDHEGFPYAQLEAMASGLPSVVTSTGDLPLIVKDGYEGYVVDIGDVAALADKIEILFREADKRSAFGLRAREKVASEYEAQNQEQKTLEIFTP